MYVRTDTFVIQLSSYFLYLVNSRAFLHMYADIFRKRNEFFILLLLVPI